jgi:hypothetical protein
LNLTIATIGIAVNHDPDNQDQDHLVIAGPDLQLIRSLTI